MRLAIALTRSFVSDWLAPVAPKLVLAVEDVVATATPPPSEVRFPGPKPGALAEPRDGREADPEMEAEAMLEVKPEEEEVISEPGRPCADERSCPGAFFRGEMVGTTLLPPLCEVRGAGAPGTLVILVESTL